MEQLKQICDMVLAIEEGLMMGAVSFSYDGMMCAMKPGHPMEILDQILAEIFWDVQSGKLPPQENLENTLKNFKTFKNAFQVKEMQAPIHALEEYLNPKVEYTFPILIGASGESSVDYPITDKELEKLRKASEKGLDFEEAPGLKTLYNKLMKAAKEKIIEDLDLTGEEMEAENLDYRVGYPEFPEEET